MFKACTKLCISIFNTCHCKYSSYFSGGKAVINLVCTLLLPPLHLPPLSLSISFLFKSHPGLSHLAPSVLLSRRLLFSVSFICPDTSVRVGVSDCQRALVCQWLRAPTRMSLPVNSEYLSLERIARYRHACSNGSPYATNKPIDIKPRCRRG